MVQIETASNWKVSSDLVQLIVVAIIFFLIYFFSAQLQVIFAKFFNDLVKNWEFIQQVRNIRYSVMYISIVTVQFQSFMFG